jgi:hypothetical protein
VPDRKLLGGNLGLSITVPSSWVDYRAIAQDGDAAAVSLLAQALKDLLCAIGVRIQ